VGHEKKVLKKTLVETQKGETKVNKAKKKGQKDTGGKPVRNEKMQKER